jgi:hypothetical protein
MINWEAIGAVGEIAGALAVIATLFYLSLQIRQNSRSLDRANEFAQANSIHNSNAQLAHVFAPIMQDADLASIYQRGIDGEQLDPVETTRFTLFAKTYILWAEDMFFQQQAHLGFAVVADSSVLLATLGPYLRKLLSGDVARTWWHRDAGSHLTPQFYEVIDRVVLTGEPLERVLAEQASRAA